MYMKINFVVLEIWLCGNGKVLEIFLKEYVRTLASIYQQLASF